MPLRQYDPAGDPNAFVLGGGGGIYFHPILTCPLGIELVVSEGYPVLRLHNTMLKVTDDVPLLDFPKDDWVTMRAADGSPLGVQIYLSSLHRHAYGRWFGPTGEILPPSAIDRALSADKSAFRAWDRYLHTEHGDIVRNIRGIHG